jgi:glycine/D-amino acid oxidase-like deaminating enzyme
MSRRTSSLAAPLRDAEPHPLWLSDPARSAPARRPPLEGRAEADLLVVGGGLTGLWTVIQALDSDPGRSVVLVEADGIATGATGRNGGFLSASLTHGIANGVSRWPEEMAKLEELGRANFEAIRRTVADHGIECGWHEGGELDVATEPHQLAWLEEEAEQAARFGWDAAILDREHVLTEVRSPTYLGGLWRRDGVALVDPARLAWGLARVAEALGARVHEQTPVFTLSRDGDGVHARTPVGEVHARRAVLATSAFPPLVRVIRRYVIPVYDYVLATEPLGGDRLDALGWSRGQGVADLGNRFHYYRLTEDRRLLWGGYDAIYPFRGRVAASREQRPATHNMLLDHLLGTFPALEGVRFSHRWAGAIDTCTRFCATFGTALGSRVSYAVGFTGLGVGASRFGAAVALDLVDARASERTALRMVRERPVPFPPEPLRYAVIQATRAALARSDRRAGRRGAWLRLLDHIGAGFDS